MRGLRRHTGPMAVRVGPPQCPRCKGSGFIPREANGGFYVADCPEPGCPHLLGLEAEHRRLQQAAIRAVRQDVRRKAGPTRGLSLGLVALLAASALVLALWAGILVGVATSPCAKVAGVETRAQQEQPDWLPTPEELDAAEEIEAAEMARGL